MDMMMTTVQATAVAEYKLAVNKYLELWAAWTTEDKESEAAYLQALEALEEAEDCMNECHGKLGDVFKP